MITRVQARSGRDRREPDGERAVIMQKVGPTRRHDYAFVHDRVPGRRRVLNETAAPPMIRRDVVTILRTEPIPILVRWRVFMIVMAKPAESGGLAHHDHGRERGPASRPDPAIR